MSDPREHPAEQPADDPAGPDPDAWATACREDLAAEQARRRERYGPPPLDPAEELRRLADTVTERLSRLGAGFGLGAAPLAAQARAALEPVLERNSEVLGHLANAGQELLAAYRAAALGHERDWSRQSGRDTTQPPPPGQDISDKGDDSPGTGGSHRIDLD